MRGGRAFGSAFSHRLMAVTPSKSPPLLIHRSIYHFGAHLGDFLFIMKRYTAPTDVTYRIL